MVFPSQLDLFKINSNVYMGVNPKNSGTQKMDGENIGKPYEQMDELVVPLFLG